MNNEIETRNCETEAKEETTEVFQLRRLLSSIVLGNGEYKNYSDTQYQEFTERLENWQRNILKMAIKIFFLTMRILLLLVQKKIRLLVISMQRVFLRKKDYILPI